MYKSLEEHDPQQDGKPEYWLLYFGGSWCGYCVQFMPVLKQFYEGARRKGLRVLYISSDSDKSAFDSYFEKMDDFLAVPYELARGQGSLGGPLKPLEQRFKVSGIPTAVLLQLVRSSESRRNQSVASIPCTIWGRAGRHACTVRLRLLRISYEYPGGLCA